MKKPKPERDYTESLKKLKLISNGTKEQYEAFQKTLEKQNK